MGERLGAPALLLSTKREREGRRAKGKTAACRRLFFCCSLSRKPPMRSEFSKAFSRLFSFSNSRSTLTSSDNRENGRDRDNARLANENSHLVDEEASSRVRRSPTKTAAPIVAPATAAVPTSLALFDLREAFEEDLVIFHRAGATIAVPIRGEGEKRRRKRRWQRACFLRRRRERRNDDDDEDRRR